jgi:serine/threonine protein kinase/tetratricopeptide (TPR) repeat protein
LRELALLIAHIFGGRPDEPGEVLAMRERDIFIQVLERDDPSEREAVLDGACGTDAELRRRVERLLAEHERQESFILDSPPPEVGVTVNQQITEQPGTTIGSYKLLQQIGEGGFGVVFMAEQTHPVQRTVALKIIKPGMDTRQVIARFEAERQALAMMDHPNIAKVLDAGTTETGRPYFVMELVKGVPITRYCDEKQLSLRERLKLFTPVCQAVQHAHQKGIIHRDIKPTNVLVAEYDNHAIPKVIDFGVAKATAQKLTDRTMFTEFGQVIGTVEYMSPEQAKFNQLDIDTRSDIYSLGVLLYELLTGSTPFEQKRLREAALDEVLRIIREEEPPKPSTRLSTSETLPSIAANRHTEPARLSKEVSGELDWIVMKALEKDRNRRYETANGFWRDIERFLANEPVTACPPTRAYQLKKFLRRNKVAVTAGGAISAALLAGLILATIGLFQARREAIRADGEADAARAQTKIATAEAAKATAVSGLLLEALQSANPDKARGADYTVRNLLDEISESLNDELKDQPEVEAAIRSTIGNAYRRLGVFDKAEPQLRESLEIRQRVYQPSSKEIVESLLDNAWIAMEMGDSAKGELRAREALKICRDAGHSDELTIKALELVALATWHLKRTPEIVQIHEEILAISQRSPDGYPEAANLLHRLADSARGRGELASSEELARTSVAMHRKLHGEFHPETAYGLHSLANTLTQLNEQPEAERCYREALAIFRKHFGDSATPVLQVLTHLTLLLKRTGNEAALDELRIQASRIASTTDTDWESWQSRMKLHGELGQLELAQAATAKAIELCPKKANCQNELAWILANPSDERLRDTATAVSLAEQAVASSPTNGTIWNTLGVSHYRADNPNAAIQALERSMELRNGGDAFDWYFLAMSEWKLGRPEIARQWFDKSVTWTDKNRPENHELRRFRVEAAELLGIADSPAEDGNETTTDLGPAKKRATKDQAVTTEPKR